MAAKARTLFLSLAAFCLPVLANVSVAEKPRLGFAGFMPASQRGLVAAKPLMAPGIAGCLCDFGGRSRSTGKERDAETGLDYFGARYFSGAQGRFTSPDVPLLAQRPGDPQSWNLYSYTRNNPLRYVDPDGHQDMPPQADCNGNQECIDSVNKTNAQFLTGVGKGLVNGAALTLDFLTCPICRPSEAPLPTEGFAEGAGNVLGSIVGGIGVGKALTAISEFVFGSSTAPALNLGSGSNPMPGAVNVDKVAGPGVNVIANAEQLPFRSGTFSQVHAINPQFNIATAETARVLQPGGSLFVTGTPRNSFLPGIQGASSPFANVSSGPMIPAHQFGVQRFSDGRPLSTLRSITEIFRKR